MKEPWPIIGQGCLGVATGGKLVSGGLKSGGVFAFCRYFSRFFAQIHRL
jgi:hypothetical protein